MSRQRHGVASPVLIWLVGQKLAVDRLADLNSGFDFDQDEVRECFPQVCDGLAMVECQSAGAVEGAQFRRVCMDLGFEFVDSS